MDIHHVKNYNMNINSKMFKFWCDFYSSKIYKIGEYAYSLPSYALTESISKCEDYISDFYPENSLFIFYMDSSYTIKRVFSYKEAKRILKLHKI